MRSDVFVQNDSGAWSLLSSSVVGRVIEDDRDDDSQFVRSQEVVLAGLVGDDSFVARVVQGEALTPAESSQWIARFRTALHIPCGRLLVGGGFDPSVFSDWVDEGESTGVGVVEVPPGHYLVDVYTYLHSMNGRVMREEWDEPLGAWFRREHPGRPFPSWVASDLVHSPEDDPGHEKDWDFRAVKGAVERGALQIELDPLDWVTFVVHLQPFDAAATLDVPDEGDWYGAHKGSRKPAEFPLGVPASGVEDPEVRGQLESLLPRRAMELSAGDAGN